MGFLVIYNDHTNAVGSETANDNLTGLSNIDV